MVIIRKLLKDDQKVWTTLDEIFFENPLFVSFLFSINFGFSKPLTGDVLSERFTWAFSDIGISAGCETTGLINPDNKITPKNIA